MKRPSFQFYPGDWLQDLQLRLVSVGARGLWIDMLCMMHQGSDYGYLKVNHTVILDANLASVVGATIEEVKGWLSELEKVGSFSRDANGCIFSRRMVRDEKIRAARAAGGILGGNPALMKPKAEAGKDNLPTNLSPTPSSSPSSPSPSPSSASPRKEDPTVAIAPAPPKGDSPSPAAPALEPEPPEVSAAPPRKTRAKAAARVASDFERPDDIPPGVWAEFLAYRLEMAKGHGKAPFTVAAMKGVIKDIRKCYETNGEKPEDALYRCMARGWRTPYPERDMPQRPAFGGMPEQLNSLGRPMNRQERLEANNQAITDAYIKERFKDDEPQ